MQLLHKHSKKKFVIGTTLLFVFIIVLLFQSYRLINTTLEDDTTASLSELVQQQQASFNSELTSNRNSLESIVKAIAAFGYNYETTTAYIESVQNNYGYETLILTDVYGDGILSNGDLVNITDSPYFEGALSGELVTSEPYISKHSGNTVVAVASPIEYMGKVEGVIAAEYNTEYLNTILSSTVGEEGYAMIVNCDGDILLSTNPAFNNMFPHDGTIFENGVSTEEVATDFMEGVDNIVTFSISDETSIAIYRPLEINRWHLVYVVPEDMVRSNSNFISSLLTAVSLAIVIVFVIVIAYIFISKQRNLRQMEKVAYYDELTGLRNLTRFKIDVAQILHDNPTKPYCIVKGDVVNFKVINELFGFTVGDEVLRTIANTGKEIKGFNFIQARVSADEFLMFAEQDFFNDMLKASTMYETRFWELLDCAPGHQINFRLGRYIIEDNLTDIDEIISRTNLAHSYAKAHNGEIYWDYDDNFKVQLLKNTEMENKMHAALQNEEFRVYLQPKFKVTDNSIIAAEALVRWIDSNDKIYYPSDFIPLFERNGFIIELDSYMLKQVCKVLQKWMQQGRNCVPISVNFSRANLKNTNFVANVKQTITHYNIPPKYIEIEITETSIADNEAKLIELLRELKEAGITVSIDDFGSGYSSLGMLKNFRADTIKLDKSFFDNYKDDKRGSLVVDSIVRLAGNLDMYTVAEGIEDVDQHGFLQEIGCDAAQGFYYAKPMPVGDFENLLFTEQ